MIFCTEGRSYENTSNNWLAGFCAGAVHCGFYRGAVARETATNRMAAKAAQMGADAIINVRYMTTSVVGSAAELLVYGTAVKLGE